MIKELEIPTASDLTGMSLTFALEMVDKELEKDNKQIVYYELMVASQGAGHAANRHGFRFHLIFTSGTAARAITRNTNDEFYCPAQNRGWGDEHHASALAD